jgi:hypothetical protein
MTDTCMVCGQKDICADCLELGRIADAKRKQYDRSAIEKHGALNNLAERQTPDRNQLNELKNKFNGGWRP